ncbi:unnamed protein product [Prorocentrum cordatum]|uniref:RNA ligase domain-containing protein n=1 Tax=Prorocentrum cordatum TaxID=2364126 RepID=A0ABN9T2T9_9DINO|nr:unnamed protein product [Polarella glacialis]
MRVFSRLDRASGAAGSNIFLTTEKKKSKQEDEQDCLLISKDAVADDGPKKAKWILERHGTDIGELTIPMFGKVIDVDTANYMSRGSCLSLNGPKDEGPEAGYTVSNGWEPPKLYVEGSHWMNPLRTDFSPGWLVAPVPKPKAVAKPKGKGKAKRLARPSSTAGGSSFWPMEWMGPFVFGVLGDPPSERAIEVEPKDKTWWVEWKIDGVFMHRLTEEHLDRMNAGERFDTRIIVGNTDTMRRVAAQFPVVASKFVQGKWAKALKPTHGLWYKPFEVEVLERKVTYVMPHLVPLEVELDSEDEDEKFEDSLCEEGAEAEKGEQVIKKRCWRATGYWDSMPALKRAKMQKKDDNFAVRLDGLRRRSALPPCGGAVSAGLLWTGLRCSPESASRGSELQGTERRGLRRAAASARANPLASSIHGRTPMAVALDSGKEELTSALEAALWGSKKPRGALKGPEAMDLIRRTVWAR